MRRRYIIYFSWINGKLSVWDFCRRKSKIIPKKKKIKTIIFFLFVSEVSVSVSECCVYVFIWCMLEIERIKSGGLCRATPEKSTAKKIENWGSIEIEGREEKKKWANCAISLRMKKIHGEFRVVNWVCKCTPATNISDFGSDDKRPTKERKKYTLVVNRLCTFYICAFPQAGEWRTTTTTKIVPTVCQDEEFIWYTQFKLFVS